MERNDARRSFDVPSRATSERVSSGSDESNLHHFSDNVFCVGQNPMNAFGPNSVGQFVGDSAKTVTADWDVNDFFHSKEESKASPNPQIRGACKILYDNAGEMSGEMSDDPLSSLLNMDTEAVQSIMNQGDVDSISAALNAVLDGNKTVESNQKSVDVINAGQSRVADSAMFHRLQFVPRPSPLGAGASAKQHFDFATLGIPANPKVQVSGDYFYGVPNRLVSPERQAQLNRYRAKRARRLLGLNKAQPVRYECRKTLADARVRVKGRFVKVSAEEKKSSMKSLQSFQSCPDLSTLATGAQALVSSTEFVDDTVHRSKRSSTSTSSGSSNDSMESNDRNLLLGRDMDASCAERHRGPPNYEQLPFLSGLQRTSKIRHCESEICLSDLADS